jgi:hypothetical protein
MAITSIKSTYSLDVKTVQLLDSMARRWNVSKSEALRRAIRLAASEDLGGSTDRAILLDRIQERSGITAADAKRWESEVIRERRGSSRKRRPT